MGKELVQESGYALGSLKLLLKVDCWNMCKSENCSEVEDNLPEALGTGSLAYIARNKRPCIKQSK